MAGRYRALLVDYGGVLTTSMSVGFAAFCVANGVDPRRLAEVLSGREGVRKPEAAIYLLAADRLRVEPDRCVFVDDMPANVDGAKAVGMAGVLHRDAAITIPKLEALLGVPLRP